MASQASRVFSAVAAAMIVLLLVESVTLTSGNDEPRPNERTKPSHQHLACVYQALGRGAGFGSNINQLVLTMALYPNTKVFVTDVDFQYTCGGGWEDVFSSVPLLPSQNPENCTHVDLEYLIDYYAENREMGLKEFWASERALEQSGAALRDLWRFAPSFGSHTRALRNYVETLPKPILAFHVRGGDKKVHTQWDNMSNWSASAFAEAMLSIPSAVGGTCLVIGDESVRSFEVGNEVSQKLNCTTVVIGGVHRGHDQRHFGSASPDERCRGTEDIVAAIESMAAADFFVGNYLSNVDRLVHILRLAVFERAAYSARDVSGREWTAWDPSIIRVAAERMSKPS